MPAENVLEHHAVDQKSGRYAERDQVGQRIKFASERTFHAPHPRHPPVEQIENAGQQNETESDFDLLKVPARDVRFDNFGQRHETAEEVARREQVRQKVDF